MRERALSTHAIPVEEDFPIARRPKDVVRDIISFLRKENFELSPVFTLESKIERVDHTIEEEIKDGKKVRMNWVQGVIGRETGTAGRRDRGGRDNCTWK